MSVKRQLSSNENLNKIPRTTNLITCFEHFSNEIYYEIFDYLDGCSTHKAFSNLNSRFQQLLTSSKYNLKISMQDDSTTNVEYICTNVILPNKHRIISIHLWNTYSIQHFFQHCSIDLSFFRLRSIILYGISSLQLQVRLASLTFLPSLHEFTCYINDNQSQINDIYHRFFQMPSLKYLSLSIPTDDEVNVLKPCDTVEHPSHIETMIISHKCTIPILTSILRCTPYIKYLTCQMLIESDNELTTDVCLSLPNLTHITMDYCAMRFFKFEAFIKQISSSVKVLKLQHFESQHYIDPNRWKQLVSQNMPYLRKFLVCCTVVTNADFRNNHRNAFIHQLTSKLWIAQTWTIELRIANSEMSYLIQKPPLKSVDQKMNSANGMKLSITNHRGIERITYFRLHFAPIVRAVRFSDLHISFSKISSYGFTTILESLPNLQSLEVSTLPVQQWSTLNEEDSETLQHIINTNSIKTVRQWMNLDLLHFLIKLCPRMEHFEVNWVEASAVENLVRVVLMKHATHIRELHYFECCVLNETDALVGQVKKLIDTEKLLSDYKISQNGNKLSLRWKPSL
ncbi:unnamed protein product [Adineta ricciae]|uniref:F-box domain-containing protein n=1 Tax=Adineta ricciae TaxID=249248 RepID=A0A814MXN8_ADIRI|nr:unnamed protein product [Adineta ricciae]CAF1084772.1 unnamed protein product [Adineta ricciae]